MKSPRISYQGLRVLRTFLEDVRREFCGADLMKALRLSSGTLYPVLLRFEQHGLLESRWEQEEPSDMGRPRRRLYRITSDGCEAARRALGELEMSKWSPELGGANA